MPYDYSSILDRVSTTSTWQDIVNEQDSIANNLINLLKRSILLPKNHYDVIASYLFIPSALAKTVPYLFLHGASGTGKSTLGRLAALWYGVTINSNNDTFASIRNSLNDRKYQGIQIPSGDPAFPPIVKEIEVNTGMVWDDIDSSLFTTNPNIYRMFKNGYDRDTDTIIMSSTEVKGENLKFRCFCPKIFSSVSPIHLDSAFKELQRRLLVIPFKRIESIDNDRLAELGVTKDNYPTLLINLDSYDWKGFESLFANFWTPQLAEAYLITRNSLARSCRGLSSTHRAISLDLLSAGIVSGVWSSKEIAINSLVNYFDWLKREVSQFGGLNEHLGQYINTEKINAVNANLPLRINSRELYAQLNQWLLMGWILEKPRPKQLKDILADYGLALQQGYWVERN